MINKVLQVIAPHHCYGCRKVGAPLCDNCNYDIIEDVVDACIVCEAPSLVGICRSCVSSYERAWYIGDRTQTLKSLIDAHKFDRVIDAADSLASLLDQRLPFLPDGTVIVPVPTITTHIRQRGYDHTLLIAKRLSRLRKSAVRQLLMRTDTQVQRGNSKKARFKQAESMFVCKAQLDPDCVYVLIDDVVTTNATVRFAAHALRDSGATRVWVAVVARQPLDKTA